MTSDTIDFDSLFGDISDEKLPDLLDALDDWTEERWRTSPACRRHIAEHLAKAIAYWPGMYRHSIGNDDQILDRHGLTGYRVQDFIPEAELGTYYAYRDGPPA